MFRIPVRADLELRLASYSHAEPLYALVEENRQYLARWLPWVEETHSAVDIADWVRRGLEQYTRNEGWQAVLWHAGEPAGCIGFKVIDWVNLRVEIGYWLAERHQGKGLMTAAARAAVDHAFTEWRLNRVEIRCAKGNLRSAAIPLRLGFAEEGILREAFLVGHEFQDLRLFAALRREWDITAPPAVQP